MQNNLEYLTTFSVKTRLMYVLCTSLFCLYANHTFSPYSRLQRGNSPPQRSTKIVSVHMDSQPLIMVQGWLSSCNLKTIHNTIDSLTLYLTGLQPRDSGIRAESKGHGPSKNGALYSVGILQATENRIFLLIK